MYAIFEYIACIKSIQYTIRQIPPKVDEVLRSMAKQENQSFNETIVQALVRGSGLTESKAKYHDLDKLAGAWMKDPKFDEAIRAQDQIDPNLWK